MPMNKAFEPWCRPCRITKLALPYYPLAFLPLYHTPYKPYQTLIISTFPLHKPYIQLFITDN